MPDVATTAKKSTTTTHGVGDDTTTSSSSSTSPPPTSGVKVHQIASMFSSLQQQTSQQQQRRSTITSLANVAVLLDNNETSTTTIVRPESLLANNFDDNKRQQGTRTSNIVVKKRSMPIRSHSSDARSCTSSVSSTAIADDLHFLDHREKFSSAKALFENLERASREQKRSVNGSGGSFSGKKLNSRVSSTSPQRRPSSNTSVISSSSTVVTVIETSTRRGNFTDDKLSSTSKRNVPNSPHVRSPPPPIPPKPPNLCSPNIVVDQTRRKFNFADAAETKKNDVVVVDDGSLDRATKELNDLMTSLQLMTETKSSDTVCTSTVPGRVASPTKKLNGAMEKELAYKNGPIGVDLADRSINQNETPSSTATLVSSTVNVKQPSSYEPYWRTPMYHNARRTIVNEPASQVEENNSTSKIVVELSSPTIKEAEKSPKKKSMPSSVRDEDSSKDSGIGSDSACSAGCTTQKSSTDDALIVELTTTSVATTSTTNGNVEYMTPEEKKNLLSPGTQAILRRPQTKPTSNDGEISSLPSHLAIPQDPNLKRLSMCSIDSASNEHGVLASDRYSMVDELDVHWLSDDQFYVEIDGVGDEDDLDTTASSSTTTNGVVIDYKKPSKIRFNLKRLRVYSTYSGVEYDRRNEDIDPVAASAEYELERRLEKMEIFELDLDKGMDGLGFSIIGMGVGADAGLEKLGIFVKSITPGGAVFRDGRICVCDQIVEVDGKNLVGVSQTYAATVLRSTTGHVNFKIGRERDLESSEIAQLIRQSLDQDQASIAREQKILADRLNMSSDFVSATNGSTSTPPPKPPAWGPSRHTPLPSSDSVFEEDNDDKTPDDNPRLQELMSQLKKPEDECQPTSIVDTAAVVAAPSPTHKIENPAFHVEPTSPSASSDEFQSFLTATEEINKFLYADETTEAEDKVAQALHVRENSSQVVRRHLADTKSDSVDSLDADDEHGLVLRIGNLETTLNDVKKEAEKYQTLLGDSQDHYDDLEQRYKTAKKKIKDYQERERDLLEREEQHLRELREKDAQYAALVKQLNDKVVELEKQLTDAQRKRASLAESASFSSMMNGPSTTTDMSPAMAYLPAKKPVRSAHIAPDDQKPSTSGLNEHKTTIEVGSETELNYVDGRRHDFGVPYTQLLDSTAAKSKADAVRQSVIMSARSLPSRHADAEVYVTCHHTMEHAEILKTQPSHVLTESSSLTTTTCNKNNSPSKSSSTSAASTSSGSPLSSRRLLDMINFRKKAASNFNKDLESAIRGGGDFEKVPEVLQWTCDDVFKFLHSLGLSKYEPEFKINRIDGCKLLQLDGSKLKSLGVANHNDRAIIKKRVKDMKMQIEKERKKENKKLLQKTSDKDRKVSKC